MSKLTQEKQVLPQMVEIPRRRKPSVIIYKSPLTSDPATWEHRTCSNCGLEIGREYNEWDETHEEFCTCWGFNLP